VGSAYLSPYGVGLGHASRMIMLADLLKNEGVKINFSSYGEATNFISKRGYECIEVPPIEFAWTTDGSFTIKHSLASIPNWFLQLSRQINQEIRNMIAYQPDVIISDSRLSPLIAARLLRIPSIVILNQVKLLLSPRIREFRIARLFESITGELLGGLWDFADRILVPDLPPPYTISGHNLWDVSSTSSKIEYVGFTSPKFEINETKVENTRKLLNFERLRPVVFFHISGPHQTRLPLIRLCLEASRYFDKEIQFVISEGKPDGNTKPRRIAESGWYYEWCPVRDEVFAMSNLIVLRGGHTALSQALQFGKPVVTIPIEKHGEQLGNSEKIAEFGAGIMLHPKDLTGKQIADAVDKALHDPSYKENTHKMMTLAENLNGIDSVAQIVRSYL
jgi:UDP-N-acetylglucosamine--N-acetylmuramyl-(pentapeptide) pyrophosphoryl-undecaprenol N-acetylglucosamine transferase